MATHTRTTRSTLYLAFLLGGLGVLVLHTTVGLGGPHTDGLIDGGVYNVLMFGAAFAVIARGIAVKAQRAAWLAMGAGLLSWSVGELYFTLFVEGPGSAGGGDVSPADGFYLAMYPCMYVALMLLVGAHLRELRISLWLDGLIGGLGAAVLAAALVLPPIVATAHGSVGSVALTLAYPIGDLLLMIFAIGALGMTGWRPGRVWLLIAASMLMTAIADSTYLYHTATDTYREGTWIEGLWPGGAILLALAAWTPWPRPTRRRIEDWRLVLVPAASLLTALGVFVYGNLHHRLSLPVLILATATVLAVSARLMLTVRENLAMLVASRRLALTDPLTGLGNRRRLMEDLELACRPGRRGEQWQLVLYDLNGFKRFNDTFGHPAGDALLTRLSDRLHAAVLTRGGGAYRMGGDEFCVLFRATTAEEEEFVRSSVAALCEQGPGFAIDAAHGEVSIPGEGSEPAAILQLADQRLYERKDETRDPAEAIRALRACVGSQFDAEVIEAVIATLSESRRQPAPHPVPAISDAVDRRSGSLSRR
jgi:diguanylate cyclase (GGDEF)-like protein